MNNIEKIMSFKGNEWDWERSGGYSGYRHCISHEWIYEHNHAQRRNLKMDFEDDYSLIASFRNQCLPFGEYPEYVIQEFLSKKYEQRVEEVYDA